MLCQLKVCNKKTQKKRSQSEIYDEETKHCTNRKKKKLKKKHRKPNKKQRTIFRIALKNMNP